MMEKSFEMRNIQRITLEYKISPTHDVGKYRFVKCNIIRNDNDMLKYVDIADSIMAVVCEMSVMFYSIYEITYVLSGEISEERMFIGITGAILMDDVKLFEDSFDMKFVATSIGGMIRGEKLTYLRFEKKGEEE